MLKKSQLLTQLSRFSTSNLAATAQTSFKYEDLQVNKTKTPAKKPEDPNKIAFGHEFSDHMLTIEWSAKHGWQKPLIEPLRHLQVHPAAKVLHYSVEIFEGMKAYRGVDGKIRLFRPDLNMNRFLKSSLRSALPWFDKSELLKCIKKYVAVEQDWVPQSNAAALYLRPTLIGTEPTLGVSASNTALLYVLGGPVGPYFPNGFKPISLMADPNYTRAFYGGVGDSKVGSNYGPTIYVTQLAHKQGCQQVLWLYGKEEQITEAGTMNIFLVFKNKHNEVELLTPPLDGLILEGVTRQSVIDMARKWGNVRVSEDRMTMKEMINLIENNQLLEAFGTGTACVVCPIERVVYKGSSFKIPTMDSGAPYMNRIASELNELQYGKLTSEWIHVVD